MCTLPGLLLPIQHMRDPFQFHAPMTSVALVILECLDKSLHFLLATASLTSTHFRTCLHLVLVQGKYAFNHIDIDKGDSRRYFTALWKVKKWPSVQMLCYNATGV
jgi:hypothetical protein